MTQQLVKAVPLLGQNGPSNLQPLKSGQDANRGPRVGSEPAERLVYKYDKAAPDPADQERQARERVVQVPLFACRAFRGLIRGARELRAQASQQREGEDIQGISAHLHVFRPAPLVFFQRHVRVAASVERSFGWTVSGVRSPAFGPAIGARRTNKEVDEFALAPASLLLENLSSPIQARLRVRWKGKCQSSEGQIDHQEALPSATHLHPLFF